MALTDLVVAGIDTAFAVCAEMVETTTITDPSSTYNPATGVVGAGTAMTGPVLLLEHEKYDGKNVKIGDMQGLCYARDFAGLKADFPVTRASGAKWRVVSAVLDPTKSFWTINIRQGS